MIHVIMGLKGSGKTKKLIDSIHEAVEHASGDVVCIEYGKKLTYDVTYRVRLVDSEEYGIRNLRYILANLNDWVKDEDRDYSYRTDIYKGIVSQYIRYIGHVFANVGGIYFNEKHVGDPVDAYKSVPKERQRAAVLFLLGVPAELAVLSWSRINARTRQ